MLKKTIAYNDYNGVERNEDFYFNLSKAELIEMEMGITGGFSEMIRKILKEQDTPALFKIFKELLLKSYGEKSDDGKRFIKSEEISRSFEQTDAYSTLLMELVSDAEKASEFFNAIIPADLTENISKSESPIPIP